MENLLSIRVWIKETIKPLVLLAFLVVSALSPKSFGQTTLSLGDVAVVDYQTTASAGRNIHFSFIIFKDVVSGTTISFTDKGWDSSPNGFTTTGLTEGVLSWTSTSTITAGTIVSMTDNGSGVWSVDIGTVTEPDNGFSLEANGDQIFAFSGTTLPTQADQTAFISAVDVNGGFVTSGGLTTNKSYKPSIFTLGENAVELTYKQNVQFNFALASPFLEGLKAQVFVASNWLGDNNPSNLPYDYSNPNSVSSSLGSTEIPTGPGGI